MLKLISATAIIMTLTSTVTSFSQSPGELNTRGAELGKQKRYDEAINVFDKAITEYDKSSAMAYHNRGWALELQGKVKEAIENYEEAFRRNHQQAITGEKLGYLYYQTGDYIKAVDTGEKVLKIQPDNKEVPKWLSDAYMKKLQQEKESRLGLQKDSSGQKGQQSAEEKKPEKRAVLYASADFSFRTGYFFEDSSFKYIKDTGLIVDLPESLNARYTPIEAWNFTLNASNPRLGLMAPNLLTHEESLESVYSIGGFRLGIGFLLSHHESVINSGLKIKESDFKTGFIFGYREKQSEFSLSIYPRLLPHDGKSHTGITMDADKIDMSYAYYSSERDLKYYSIFSFRDFYFFDHDNVMSNYFGVYDIGLGVSLGKISILNKSFAWAFTIEYRQRFYLQDINNEDPYSILPNGQGFFGMNFSKWFEGSPFSGVQSMGSEITLRIDEQIMPYLYLYQKIISEVGYKSSSNIEICFQIGVGAMY